MNGSDAPRMRASFWLRRSGRRDLGTEAVRSMPPLPVTGRPGASDRKPSSRPSRTEQGEGRCRSGPWGGRAPRLVGSMNAAPGGSEPTDFAGHADERPHRARGCGVGVHALLRRPRSNCSTSPGNCSRDATRSKQGGQGVYRAGARVPPQARAGSLRPSAAPRSGGAG
jgi:hypothetical protein